MKPTKKLRLKTINTFKGVVWYKEDGIAFINFPDGRQIWLPSKGILIGEEVFVTIKAKREK